MARCSSYETRAVLRTGAVLEVEQAAAVDLDGVDQGVEEPERAARLRRKSWKARSGPNISLKSPSVRGSTGNETRAQHLEVLLGQQRRDDLDQEALECAADRVDLPDVRRVERGDPKAAAPVLLDQAALEQRRQRLADRGAADAERVGQLLDHDRLAGSRGRARRSRSGSG